MELFEGPIARKGRHLSGALVASFVTIFAGTASAQQSAALPNGAAVPMTKPPAAAPATKPAPRPQAARPSPQPQAAKPPQAAPRAPQASPRVAQAKPVARPVARPQVRPAEPAEDPSVRALPVNPGSSVPLALASGGVAAAEVDAVMKAAGEHLQKAELDRANSLRLRMGSGGEIAGLQIFSATSLMLDLQRRGDGGYDLKAAPGATQGAESEKRFVAPTEGAAVVRGPSRNIVPASIGVGRFSLDRVRSNLAGSGIGEASARDAASALSAVAPAGVDVTRATFQITYGKTEDGATKILGASLDAPSGRAQVYWFAPDSMPEGFFDSQGRRVGGAGFSDPIPGAGVSSGFGMRGIAMGRRYVGGFHNGLDIEGKYGTPIYAAADGIVNYQGWYYNYGRTVKITHGSSLETLYAHMSRFADGVAPGSSVRKGDLIGYVGSTGRSTGPHLHFSVIANGEFVDPSGYLAGGSDRLAPHEMVTFRRQAQQVDQAVKARSGGFGWFGGGDVAPGRPQVPGGNPNDPWKDLNRL